MKVTANYILEALTGNPIDTVLGMDRIYIRLYSISEHDFVTTAVYTKTVDNFGECCWQFSHDLGEGDISSRCHPVFYVGDLLSMYIDDIDFKTLLSSDAFHCSWVYWID